jgi:hypothetical protein
MQAKTVCVRAVHCGATSPVFRLPDGLIYVIFLSLFSVTSKLLINLPKLPIMRQGQPEGPLRRLKLSSERKKPKREPELPDWANPWRDRGGGWVSKFKFS